MLLDKEEIMSPANTGLTIRFNYPDQVPHNLVIIKSGSLQKFGKAADAMATMKDVFEKSFVPNLSEVLYATPLVDRGKSYDLDITTGGARIPIHLFISGSLEMMKGVIKIIKK